MKFTAAQIAELLQGEVDGNPEAEVSDFAKIEEGKPGTLTFLHNPKYESFIYKTAASVCLVNKDFEPKEKITPTLIRLKNAYQGLTRLLEIYEEYKSAKSGIEQPSYIAESASYREDLYLGAFAYVGKNVELGENVKIYPHAYIGDDTKIDDNVTIYSGVKIYPETQIGNNCVINSNAVIGAAGFGYVPNEEGVYKRIPQIGNVILEDDVEIGSATTIDRATMGSTIIRKGVKLDNQIQIAHNVEIDEHTAIAAQTGVAGSAKIGKNSIIGGQVGIVGHIEVGDRVKIQAQSGIIGNIKDDAVLQGSPALPYSNYNKSYVYFKNLPKLAKRLGEVEKKLKDNG